MTQANMSQSISKTKKTKVQFTKSLLYFLFPTCHDLEMGE